VCILYLIFENVGCVCFHGACCTDSNSELRLCQPFGVESSDSYKTVLNVTINVTTNVTLTETLGRLLRAEDVCLLSLGMK
jgi:hypothetical protein